jgi:hypothetical protein
VRGTEPLPEKENLMLTLKRYGNGRLYDIANKKYVTKAELTKRIQENEKVRIVHAKTGKDVTKSVISSLPASKMAEGNGKNKPLWNIASMKTRVDGHRKRITKQIDKSMETVLEMMNFPSKGQVLQLNAGVRKLTKKVEDLQKRHVESQKRLKLEHKKEMEELARQCEKRIQMAVAAPEASNA